MVVGGSSGVTHQRQQGAASHLLAHLHLERRVVVVAGVEAILLAARGHGGVVPDGDGQGTLLRSAGIDHRAGAGRVNRGAVRVVELHALVLLEVAAHSRAIAIRLVNENVVVQRYGTAKPGGERRTGGAG